MAGFVGAVLRGRGEGGPPGHPGSDIQSHSLFKYPCTYGAKWPLTYGARWPLHKWCEMAPAHMVRDGPCTYCARWPLRIWCKTAPAGVAPRAPTTGHKLVCAEPVCTGSANCLLGARGCALGRTCSRIMGKQPSAEIRATAAVYVHMHGRRCWQCSGCCRGGDS